MSFKNLSEGIKNIIFEYYSCPLKFKDELHYCTTDIFIALTSYDFLDSFVISRSLNNMDWILLPKLVTS